MGDIRRYATFEDELENGESYIVRIGQEDSGDICYFADHKAVVDSKDNRILELETDLMFKEESIKLQNKSMEAMQNKIEELEYYLTIIRHMGNNSDSTAITMQKISAHILSGFPLPDDIKPYKGD